MNGTRSRWPDERLLQWTPRQRQVLALIAKGKTNAQIAERLGVTLAGAKWHVSEVLTKLNAASREEAAVYWRERHGVAGRARRLVAGLFVPLSLKSLAFGGAAVGAVAAVGAGALVLNDGATRDGGRAAQPSATATTAAGTFDLRDMASPFQAAIVADGHVSDEEYDRAVTATVTCLEHKGYRVTVTPGRDAARAVHWVAQEDRDSTAIRPALVPGWGDDPPPEYGLRPDDAVSWCDFQYMQLVSIYWFEQNRPPAAYEARVEASFRNCLAVKGYELNARPPGDAIASGPSAEELIRFGEGRRSFMECAASMRRTWGMALFGGTDYGVFGLDDPDTPEDESIEQLPDVMPAVP